MANKSIPTIYKNVTPPEGVPRRLSAYFSLMPERTPAYVRIPAKPFVLVQSDFSDDTPQAKLREQFLAGNIRKLIMFVDASEIEDQWFASWEQYAEECIEKLVAPAGKKSGKKSNKLACTPMVSISSEGQRRIKLVVDTDVLYDCARACGMTETDIFDLPQGDYGLIFTVTGIWQNASNYGISMRAVKLALKKQAPEAKRLRPADFVMPDEEEVEEIYE